ncbi:MAG: methyltransferase domain-containing protein [Candidatus Bipolaricaulia bacterium]
MISVDDFSFRKFARHSFYKGVNAQLIDLSGIKPGQHVIDLACGTGAVTKLILEKLRGAKDSLVIGVDYSASALKQAREELKNAKQTMVQLIRSRAEQLSQVVRESVDTVIFCNAIHMVRNKDRLMDEVSKTLRQAGVFAFNTSFFEGAHLPETERFYRRWMLRALRNLKRRYGLAPNKAERVAARRQLTPEEYVELLHRHGFSVKEQQIYTAAMTLESWLDISQYEEFIAGVMPGVPLDKASECLKQGVIEVFEELELEATPRNWLDVVAVKN